MVAVSPEADVAVTWVAAASLPPAVRLVTLMLTTSSRPNMLCACACVMVRVQARMGLRALSDQRSSTERKWLRRDVQMSSEFSVCPPDDEK
ncbi:hypothetical protein GCM10025876_25930 [Demequina litorisediminis]|uniref:Secreted protein n=2 Tax=Demequina litorisediminis TaxID=1849022 RepID=A0ABQ6II50_9MICO|nr:hypothetical protein GCM10025876_25930 [Demequina litorisediminis]